MRREGGPQSPAISSTALSAGHRASPHTFVYFVDVDCMPSKGEYCAGHWEHKKNQQRRSLLLRS